MKKPIPLHVIIARLPKGLPEQIIVLQKMKDAEKPYSVRRNELESILKGKMTKQLIRETRAARKVKAA